MPDGIEQRNFEARFQEYETFVKGCLAELTLLLPEPEIKGVYTVGEQYEFYRDIKQLLALATKHILIIDPYLNTEIFDVYAGGVDRGVHLNILTSNLPSDVLQLAHKYAAGGNFSLRTTNAIHDRVIFTEDHVWMVGQSLKDAAKKKPTYIVEHDLKPMEVVYDDIWKQARVVI